MQFTLARILLLMADVSTIRRVKDSANFALRCGKNQVVRLNGLNMLNSTILISAILERDDKIT